MTNVLQYARKAWAGFWETLTVERTSRLFFFLFLLTFPFQIRTFLYTGSSYVTGEFNYFSTLFLYASDLFFLISFLLWGAGLWMKKSTWSFSLGNYFFTFLLLAFLLVAAGNVFLVDTPKLQFFMLFRLTELFLVYLMVVNRILKQEQIVLVLLAGLCFQALLAVYQYVLQSSVGLGFLGELSATPATLGVAKIDVGSQKFLRAFGTMPHANVLGGLLFMGIMYALALLKKYRWIVLGVLVLLSLGLLFTFSRAAFFALVAAFLLYISLQNGKIGVRYVLLAVSLLLFFIVIFRLEGVMVNRLFFEDTNSTTERALYLRISRDMIADQPLGVGLGGFTLHMQDYTSTKLAPWLYQPVHNIFFLAANETGILGGILYLSLFVLGFYQLLMLLRNHKTPENRFAMSLLIALLAGVAVIGCFDHYFYTVYQAQVMLYISLGFVSSLLSSDRLPARNS